MKIGIGGDHAGFEYKTKLIQHLKSQGYEIIDFGPGSDASVDYPDHVHPLADTISNDELTYGILICGSANGVAITANKHQKVRAGLAWKVEVAELIRQHNDANIVCVPARFVSIEETLEIVDAFLNTDFEGGRHQRRVDKIPC